MVIIIKFPDKKEGISDVLVCRSLESINYSMNDLADLIDENWSALLQNFSGVSVLSDVAETENTYALLTWEERVYVISFSHIFRDQPWAGLTQTDGQQSTNFE